MDLMVADIYQNTGVVTLETCQWLNELINNWHINWIDWSKIEKKKLKVQVCKSLLGIYGPDCLMQM